ncbi:MAG: hypothetical protein JHC71_11955 [Blastococcus sp.]|nr:hypothetical protein [Blastococcus sp.]
MISLEASFRDAHERESDSCFGIARDPRRQGNPSGPRSSGDIKIDAPHTLLDQVAQFPTYSEGYLEALEALEV